MSKEKQKVNKMPHTSRASIPQIKVPQKSILNTAVHSVNTLKIIHNGVDVTPKPIAPYNFKGGRERQLAISEIHSASVEVPVSSVSRQSRIYKSESMTRFQTEFMTTMTRRHSTYLTVESESLGADADLFSEEDKTASVSANEETSATNYEIAEPPLVPMPPYVTLTLYETETYFVLDINSSTAEKDSPEGVAAEIDNTNYEYLTEGKGKNRKVVNASVQTIPVLVKSRDTKALPFKQVNHYSFASIWDMHDTYSKKDVSKSNLAIIEGGSDESLFVAKEDVDFRKLLKNSKFLEATCVIQRILANNTFNEEQKRFRGLKDPSPFRDDIEFNYKLKLLWTFANEETKSRCVTGFCWNPSNKDVLAVAYGKFYYDEEATGLVLIWNIKNPVQPERDYQFSSPVTSLDFSNQDPNFLAIGFYSGDVKVIDISMRIIYNVGQSNKINTQLFEPIWQVKWFTDHDYYKGQEFLAATCQDGRIYKFKINSQSIWMTFSQMMRITVAEGQLKGINTLRKCNTKTIPLTRFSPALIYTPHPMDPNIYYIGTGEGVVHQCSKNYYHQHLDLFMAHDSPMYGLVFSPFCNKLFLTCGDDWALRLWLDGISEPLFEIKKRMSGVQGVAWSPSHSTVIASISGNEIFIWDLQRKTYDSQSATVNPTKARNTFVNFTDDGRCLVVADVEGNVHLFALEDMPFTAFFQQNLLIQSIKRSLVTRPDLLDKIDKLGNLNFEEASGSKLK